MSSVAIAVTIDNATTVRDSVIISRYTTKVFPFAVIVYFPQRALRTVPPSHTSKFFIAQRLPYHHQRRQRRLSCR